MKVPLSLDGTVALKNKVRNSLKLLTKNGGGSNLKIEQRKAKNGSSKTERKRDKPQVKNS